MNNTLKQLLLRGHKLALLGLSCFLLTPVDAFAQGKRPPRHPGGGGGAVVEHKEDQRPFDLNVLRAEKDKFEAYKVATFSGVGYYTLKDRALRDAHAKSYRLITKFLVEDRLAEDAGRDAILDLIRIGEGAKKLLGDAEALSEDDAEDIQEKITALVARLHKASDNKVNPKILTPVVNQRQVILEELYFYAKHGKGASSGQAASILRYIKSLEKKEDKLKADNKVSDREREGLLEETTDIWKSVIRFFE
ncbi:MAG: hypothetical protein ACPG32_05930 [Akkermansiaceae bacterium]